MTMQSGDKLFYHNKEYEIRNELYLEKYIHTYFCVPPMKVYSTACHRGYFATFEIKKGKLFLIELNHQFIDQPVHYTGSIDLIDGYAVVEQGLDSQCFVIKYNYVLKIWFKDGIVTREEKQKNM